MSELKFLFSLNKLNFLKLVTNGDSFHLNFILVPQYLSYLYSRGHRFYKNSELANNFRVLGHIPFGALCFKITPQTEVVKQSH